MLCSNALPRLLLFGFDCMFAGMDHETHPFNFLPFQSDDILEMLSSFFTVNILE